MPVQSFQDLLKGLEEFPDSKWYQMGLFLEVDKRLLDNIHTNNIQPSGVERCKVEMLDKWFNSSKGTPTWAKVYDALCEARQSKVAAKIATKYGTFFLVCVCHN